MNIGIENILLIGSVLLFISILAGKTSYRFGVPTLILFLGVGMMAGSEGVGGIHFDNAQLAQFIGIVALNFILFSGGLDTQISAIRPIIGQGLMLSTVGVLVTAGVLGIFVHLVTDFTLLEGLLFGAIVSSTDAAAVFSILRAKSLALKTNIRPTLELESGSNDPMAYVLTTGVLSLITQPELSAWSLIPFFLKQMIFGGALGVGFGFFSQWMINRIRLDFEGLYPVLVIALMFGTFSFTEFFGGNGFLAVYIAAVILGNNRLIHKKSIIKMFDGLAWLMQIVLFLTLGLLVFPSQLLSVAGLGLLISFFLIFIARPLAVFASLSPFQMKTRRRWYISWVGLRGAVPIVFATYPLLAGINQAQTMFNLVFFVALVSVLFQGTTLGVVARWLHVALPEKAKAKLPMDVFMSETSKRVMVELEITNPLADGIMILDQKLPRSVWITLIDRGGQFITPEGRSKLYLGDKIVAISDDDASLNRIKEVFQS